MLRRKTGVLSLSHTSHGGRYIRCLKNVRIIGTFSAFLLLILSLASIFPIINHREQAEATAGVEEVPTIAIATGNDQATVDIIPQDATGTYSSSDRTTSTNNRTASFSVTTSNYTGYTLGIKASDNAGQLVNASYSDTLDSITTATPATTFENDTTGTYTNKWGYKPNFYNSIENTTNTYYPAPITTESILDTKSTATTGNYTIDVAAKVDYTKAAGTYTNTYILTATANPVAYAINYYTVDGTYNNTTKKMNLTQVGTTQASSTNTAASITLAPTDTPTRSTYTFAGWCYNADHSQVSTNDGITATYNAANTKITAYHDPGTVCNGTIYATGASMPIDPTIDNTDINLYAVWTPTTFDQAYAANNKTKATVGSKSYYKMQDMSTAICNAVSPMQSTILFDYRKNVPANDGTSTTNQVDGTAYHIAKLPDGRCWMLDNLALNLNNQNVVDDLKAIGTTDANTHVNSASLTAFKNGGGTDSNGRAQTGYAKSNWTTTNSYVQPTINRRGSCVYSINKKFQCLEPYQSASNYTYNTTIDKYGIPASDSSGTADTYNAYGLGNYKVGNYYNYCAASAGSYCYTDSHTDTKNASYDICPINWRLPRGGIVTYPNTNYNEFEYLYNEISKISITPADSTKALSFQTMLSMPVSGRYNSGTAYGQGAGGWLWSSTYNGPNWMHYLYVSGTAISPQDYYARSFGVSVRCLAQ